MLPMSPATPPVIIALLAWLLPLAPIPAPEAGLAAALAPWLGASSSQAPPTLAQLRGAEPGPTRPDLVAVRGGYLERRTARAYDHLKACLLEPACSGLDRPVRLRTCSRFRSYARQRNKWLAEMTARRATTPDLAARVQSILRYLALPGTSRHHWGTDIDLSFGQPCTLQSGPFLAAADNAARCDREEAACRARRVAPAREAVRTLEAAPTPTVPRAAWEARRALRAARRHLERAERRCAAVGRWCFRGDGEHAREFAWLRANAPRFGFCQPYAGPPAQRNPGRFTRGYEPEPWHWSYCPVARERLRAFRAHMDDLAPAFEDVFPRADRVGRREAQARRVYRDLILPAFREHVLNIAPRCATCDESGESGVSGENRASGKSGADGLP